MESKFHYDGPNLESFPNIKSEDSCNVKCNANEKCGIWEFDKRTNWCYLKSIRNVNNKKYTDNIGLRTGLKDCK